MKLCSLPAKLILAGLVILMPAASACAGGYFLVDKEGRVLNRAQDQPVEVGAGNGKAVFKDRSGTRVFDAEWDASNRILIIKGQNVYLRIHGDGKIEKLGTIQEGEPGRTPLVIQPVIPVFPGQRPSTPVPAPQQPPSAPR